MAKRNPAFYEVIVGNIGKVWQGSNYMQAMAKYAAYVKQSKSGVGRAGGEQVSLWKNGDVIREHDETEPGYTSNPRIPNGRLVPARIRHNGKTYAGKVKRVNGRVKIFVTPQVARKIGSTVRPNPVLYPVVEVRHEGKGATTKVIDKLPYHKAIAKMKRMKKLHPDRAYRLGEMF